MRHQQQSVHRSLDLYCHMRVLLLQLWHYMWIHAAFAVACQSYALAAAVEQALLGRLFDPTSHQLILHLLQHGNVLPQQQQLTGTAWHHPDCHYHHHQHHHQHHHRHLLIILVVVVIITVTIITITSIAILLLMLLLLIM